MLRAAAVRSSSSAARWAAAAACVLGLFCSQPAYAYIGPGAGFAVIGSFFMLLAAVLLSGLVLVTWPLRALVIRRRRRRAYARSRVDRVVVLGLDGLDPNIVEEMIAAGRLPTLAKLRETGTYARLGTTCPAMSPVAWSSFMTGTGPGRHGIFDFLRRDPRTYLPDLSSAEIRQTTRVLPLGLRWLKLNRTVVRPLRRSKPFWTVLGEHGIPSVVLRVPITFPPEPFHGLLLSGMCVPDLRGTQGSFTLLTTADLAAGRYTGGERIQVRWDNGSIRTALPGPPAAAGRDGSEISAAAPLVIARDGKHVRLQVGGERVLLREREFSEWIPVEFRLSRMKRASGICLFYLKQVEPDLELYVSPINVDPERPALPVSHPAVYSIYLSKRLGRFATLGLAEDTWALNEGVLDDGAFLDQCQLLFEERERMLLSALRSSRQGCVVCVFDTTDRVQHMFWRERAAGGDDTRSSRAIEAVYEQADALVGRVMSQLGPREALIVLSDHGFTAFARGVNINAWLRDHGYLSLKPGATGEAEWLRDVDWSRTRAYALGLGGLYLNVKGREANGVVAREEAQVLKEELIGKLTGLRDEATGAVAIERVLDTEKESPGPYAASGPDLTVGYAPGYRASWDAAQGKVSGPVIEDNTRHWSGDHCVDPKRVPGVVFCNQPLAADAASITDIAPTVLSLFGVQTPRYMQGRSLAAEG